MVISILMLVIFCVYIFGMILIGFIVWCLIKNFDDYIFGGCSLGLFVMVLLVGVLDMSGWLLMGLSGVIFLLGIFESWIVIGLMLGVWINWKLVVGCLCVYIEFNNNVFMLLDYFIGWFEDKS